MDESRGPPYMGEIGAAQGVQELNTPLALVAQHLAHNVKF